MKTTEKHIQAVRTRIDAASAIRMAELSAAVDTAEATFDEAAKAFEKHPRDMQALLAREGAVVDIKTAKAARDSFKALVARRETPEGRASIAAYAGASAATTEEAFVDSCGDEIGQILEAESLLRRATESIARKVAASQEQTRVALRLASEIEIDHPAQWLNVGHAKHAVRLRLRERYDVTRVESLDQQGWLSL